jgi:negative modulator of initiation of replication
MEAVIVEEVMVEPPSIDNVLNYINKEELAMQRGAVGRFLLILAALYRVHSESFAVVSEIRGRDRLYFAKSKDELSASGSSTKPLQIPDSPFWVMTNSNTTRKKMMLTKASLMLGYTNEDAENIRDLL